MDFSLTLYSFLGARGGEGDAERLEDRLEHVLRVGSVEEAHVQRHTSALGEALEEASRDVRSEAADTRLRQIDIGDEQRLVRRLKDDRGERLRRGHEPRTEASALSQQSRQRAPERGPRFGDLGFGGAGLDLEDEIEGRVLGEPLEQTVQHREPGLDGRRPLYARVDADAAPPCRTHGARVLARSNRSSRWAARPMPPSSRGRSVKRCSPRPDSPLRSPSRPAGAGSWTPSARAASPRASWRGAPTSRSPSSTRAPTSRFPRSPPAAPARTTYETDPRTCATRTGTGRSSPRSRRPSAAAPGCSSSRRAARAGHSPTTSRRRRFAMRSRTVRASST